MTVVIKEHFEKIGTPTISDDYILTTTSSSDYIQTEVLRFDKPFIFKFGLTKTLGVGNVFDTGAGGHYGFNIYYNGSNNSLILALGNGTSGYNDLVVYYDNTKTIDYYVLEWDGNTFSGYVVYTDEQKGNVYTLNRTTPIGNRFIQIGRQGQIELNMKIFNLEFKDGTYKFNLVERKELSPIEESLAKLAFTKAAIRESINNKGVEVDASLPFSEYASKIEEIQIESVTMYDVTIPIDITSEITIEEV